jgi:hypothetical protein
VIAGLVLYAWPLRRSLATPPPSGVTLVLTDETADPPARSGSPLVEAMGEEQ